MTRAAKGSILNDYILIIAGCFLMAVGLNSFLEPKSIVIGGATGLSIILESVCRRVAGVPLPLWLGNMLLNLPLFAVSFRIFGFKFLRKTLFATLFLSFALWIAEFLPEVEADYPIACVFGSALSGIGLGLIFKSNATTGGSDLAASLIHKYVNSQPVSRLMLYIDVVIIGLGFFVFGTIPAFYAIIGAYIIAKVIDMIVEGAGFAKAVFIVSEKSDELGQAILNELQRGVTRLFGEGLYTGKSKNVILCVVQVRQLRKIKEISREIDENSFVFVADVREVMGEFEER